MNFFPTDSSIYTFIKDFLWTVSIIVGVVSNVINICKNNEISREHRRLKLEKQDDEKGLCSKNGYTELKRIFDRKEKKLPKKHYGTIYEINNNEAPTILYDKGFYFVGWIWFIKEYTVVLIEKDFLSYKYRVWKETDEKWGWSEPHAFLGIKNDTALKDRINFVKEELTRSESK